MKDDEDDESSIFDEKLSSHEIHRLTIQMFLMRGDKRIHCCPIQNYMVISELSPEYKDCQCDFL